jgi:hypothetical protein
VQGADEVVDARVRGERADEGCVLGGAEPFGFEADEDVDLGRVFGLEVDGMGEEGGVPGGE